MNNFEYINIKLTTPHTSFPLIRQLPNFVNSKINYKFFINDNSNEEFDFWVVYDYLINDEITCCNKENIILITAEPPSIRNYNERFSNQFSKIITCHTNIIHSNLVFSQQGLPWMAGVSFDIQKREWDTENYKDINDLAKPIEIEKINKICIITSNKVFTKGHKKRLDFVLKLKHKLNDFIDIYGNGFQPIEDKLDILSKYKYALVIENSFFEDYWTEKLSDAFIAECLPIYYGCPNIYKYFNKNSNCVIDISNFELSYQVIKNILSDNEYYNNRREEILNSKNEVLYKYNLFNLIQSNIDIYKRDLPKSPITLKPLKNTLKEKISFKIKQFLST